MSQRRGSALAYLALAVLLSIGVYGGVGTYANGRADSARQDASIRQNEANTVTACQNGNESREANRAIWGFVLDLLSATSTDPAAAAFLEEFRGYVNTVYQPHDCARLDLKYPLPDPPSIPAP